MQSADNRGKGHHREARTKSLSSSSLAEEKEKEEREKKKLAQKNTDAKAQRSENKAVQQQVRQKATARMIEVKNIQAAVDKQRMLDSVKVFSCPRKKCKKTFTTEAQLTAHERTHAIEDVMNASKKEEQIKQKSKKTCAALGCKKSFKSEDGLAQHVRDVHSASGGRPAVGANNTPSQLRPGEQQTATPPEQPITQTQISSQANEQQQKKLKSKSKSKKKQVACPEPDCNKKFRSEEGLTDHMRAIHDKTDNI